MTDEFFEEIRPDQEAAAALHQQNTAKILNTLRNLQHDVDMSLAEHTDSKKRLDAFIAAVMRLDPSERPKIAEITEVLGIVRGRLYQIRGPK
jgi:hypothetical protein